MSLSRDQLEKIYAELLQEGASCKEHEGSTMPAMIISKETRTAMGIRDCDYYAVWGKWYLQNEGIDL